MTATTALTAQNTQGVRAIHEIPTAFVQQQIDACIEDIGVDVVKTGMPVSVTLVQVSYQYRNARFRGNCVDGGGSYQAP